jgi:hypothetical protein
MSGRKINDHSSWVGKGSNGTVFPMGCKLKSESSAGGVGALSKYEDTTETIKSQQEMSKAKVNGHPMKSGYRN